MLRKTLAPVALVTLLALPLPGQQWTQKYPAASPPATFEGALAYDAARSEVVLFGGANESGYISGTWVWNGANWTQRTTPAARLPGWGVRYLLPRAECFSSAVISHTTWLTISEIRGCGMGQPGNNNSRQTRHPRGHFLPWHTILTAIVSSSLEAGEAMPVSRM